MKLYSGDIFLTTTPTNAETGAFTFANVAPGSYVLKYVTGGAAPTTCGGAKATVGDDGSTSLTEGSPLTTYNNYNWVNAKELTPAADPAPATTKSTSILEHVDVLGRADWFKVRLPAGSSVAIQGTQFDVNYDILLFSDIAGAYASLTTNQDLLRIAAETNGPGRLRRTRWGHQ